MLGNLDVGRDGSTLGFDLREAVDDDFFDFDGSQDHFNRDFVTSFVQSMIVPEVCSYRCKAAPIVNRVGVNADRAS